MNTVNIPTKYYSIADLVFVNSKNTQISDDDLNTIHDRFTNLVTNFNVESGENHGNQKNADVFPFNSMTAIGAFKNRLILHFTNSFGEPLMFVYDIPSRKIMNYLEIEEAKEILDDRNYEDIRENLRRKKTLSLIIPNVKNINDFTDLYKAKLREMKAKSELGDFECIEITSDEYGVDKL